MELCLIWAQGHNRAIGIDNTLPWRLPEDLKHFRDSTKGYTVIMGRKTFESLPEGPLKDRQNIVLSRSAHASQPNTVFAANLRQALELAATAKQLRCFVIGGAELYAQALKVADSLWVTEVDVEVPGADAFAPEIPAHFLPQESSPWLESKENGIKYRFRRFVRDHRLG